MTHPTAMPKDSKPALTPKLRFPEFQHAPAWQEKSLGSLGKFTRGLTYSTDDVTTQGLPVLRSTNIQDGTLVLDRDLVFVSKTCPDSLRLQKGDIVICMSNGSKALVGKSAEYFGDYPGDITVGAFCSFFRPELPFSKIAFQTSDYARYVGVLIAGGNINNLNNSVLEEFRFPIPPSSAEQQKIAECLSTLDELIGAESQKLDALKTHKKGLMQQLFPREGETRPRLRFPEFRDAPEWESKTVDDLVDTITPPKKLLTSDYRPAGQFPVIDQSQDYICGWTDDEEAVIDDDLPVVVFGDHTCALKFVDRPFAQGADGIKILKAKADVRDDFLFYSLQANPVQQESYKRHFSTLRERVVAFPDKDSGEQRRIAACVSSLDDLIAAQSERLEALRAHKRGLMQQLFPNPSGFES